MDLLMAPGLSMTLDECMKLSYVQYKIIMQELNRRRRSS